MNISLLKIKHLCMICGAGIGCLFAFAAGAQNVKDSSLAFSSIGFQYAFDLPAADLAKSFGANSTIGASFWHKTKTNWMLGLEYNYVFGETVKINPLDSIQTREGYLINGNGQFQDLSVYERGHFVMLKARKILNSTGQNPNSGLFVQAGAGFLLHQVLYYWAGDAPPALSGSYIKGYDRLTYGPALSQSFGYINFSNGRLLNFSAELEAAEGFTKNQRAYNYDTRQKDNTARLDITIGLKIAWLFPLYGRIQEKYYR